MYAEPPRSWTESVRRAAQRTSWRRPSRLLVFTALALTPLLLIVAAGLGIVMLGGSVPWPSVPTTNCIAAPGPAPSGADRIVSPMKPGSFSISSGFGPRNGVQHRGTDFAADTGTPILAAAPGEVIRAGPATGFGRWIVIKHQVKGKRVDTVYGHMWPSGVGVRRGEKVRAGQVIAQVGSNGQSTGPHLHFEVWRGGRFGGHPVDPMPVLSAPAPKPKPKPPPPPRPAPQVLAAPTASVLMPHGPSGPQKSMSLSPKQQGYVDSIVGVGKGMGLPPQAWVIAVATTMVESRLLMYANYGNSESLRLPHDAVGSDHDSVGLFQQRDSWGSTRTRMNPAASARLFYEALRDVEGWRGMPLTIAAQSVQRSAFPDRYASYELAAANAVRASYGAPPIGKAPAPPPPCQAA